MRMGRHQRIVCCVTRTVTKTYHHPAISFREDPPHNEFANDVVYCDIVDPIVNECLAKALMP